MEYLKEIWAVISPYFAGVTITGVISCIIYACLRSGFNKAINRIDVEKICNKATELGVERVKAISFTQSIQPLCESELKKITEQANSYIVEELKKAKEDNKQIIEILASFAAYFDNSVGVPEEKKEALREAIKKATGEDVKPSEVLVYTPSNKREEKEYEEELATASVTR